MSCNQNIRVMITESIELTYLGDGANVKWADIAGPDASLLLVP